MADKPEAPTEKNEWATIHKTFPREAPCLMTFDKFHLTSWTPGHDNKDENITTTINDNIPATNSDTALLMHLYQHFGHIPFSRLQKMAKQGIIKPTLACICISACAACMFRQAIQRCWQDKLPTILPVKKPAIHPGKCISVNQLVSPTPGLVAQMTDILATEQYTYATIYVDQVSKYSYIHFQQTATMDETLRGKRQFEQHMSQMGITMQSYLVDNDMF